MSNAIFNLIEMCFDAGRADADSNLAGKCILGKCFNMVSHMLGAAIKLNS